MRYSKNGTYPTPLTTLTTENLTCLPGKTGKKTRKREIILLETPKVEEEDTEVVEVVEDTGEGEDTSPTAVVWEEENTMTLIEGTESIDNGMIVKATEKEIKDTTPKSIKSIKIWIEIMKIEKEPEVHLEGKDPEERTETIKEITMTEETTALIEGIMLLKEGVDGSKALIEEGKEVGETTLLIKGENTKEKIEGVARDP